MLAADVVIRETDFRPYFDPVSEYSRMLSELTEDKERNLLIVKDVAATLRESRGVCLVLSDRKAHCENLRVLLKYRHQITAEVLTGDVSSKDRKTLTARLQAGDIKVLIATGQLIGEGFDCPQLETLFLVTPFRFSGRLLQYLGRVLRPAPGTRGARVFDYVDIHVDTLVKAANARQRVYPQPARTGKAVPSIFIGARSPGTQNILAAMRWGPETSVRFSGPTRLIETPGSPIPSG